MSTPELAFLLRALGAQQAANDVKKVDNAVSGLHGSTSILSRVSSGASNAMHTFTGRIKQLGTAAAGVLGVGGLLSIGGLLEQSVTKLEDFSLALEKVQTLTGETARDSGALVLLFEKFGLSTDQVGQFAGFAEKTLGKLNETTAKGAKASASAALKALELRKAYIELHGGSVKAIDALIKEQKARDQIAALQSKSAGGLTKLQALDRQYGLQLVDSKGKIVSYSEELRQLADFYDRNHDAATRAFVASTLLGRGYSQLAPILDQGSAAIRQAAAEADSLGLGSQDTAQRMVDFRNTMRDLGQQVDVLQLSIGMALVPVLDKFAHQVTDFITTHRQDIVNFFSGAANVAEQVASTVGGLASAIAGFWNSIPEPVRNLLITGIATDRTIKFLFGFSPIGLVKSGIESLFQGAVSSAGKGLAATLLGGVQKVWVMNPGFGGGGGGVPGGVTGAAEGAGAAEGGGFISSMSSLGAGGFAQLIALALLPALPAAIVLGINSPQQLAAYDLNQRRQTAAARGLNPANVPTDFQAGPRNVFANWLAAQHTGTGGLSPDERDQKNALERIRTDAEHNRIALVSAQQTGTHQIVAAIRQGMSFNATFNLNGLLAGRVTTRVRSGTTLNRFAGKLVPLGG